MVGQSGNVTILACARFDGDGFLVFGENDATVHGEVGTFCLL